MLYLYSDLEVFWPILNVVKICISFKYPAASPVPELKNNCEDNNLAP